MSLVSQEQVIEHLSRYSLSEVRQLVELLEKSWGVSLTLTLSSDPKQEKAAPLTIVLESVGQNTLKVSQVLRQLFGFSMTQTSNLLRSTPTQLATDVGWLEAQAIREKLREAGARVTLR